MNSKPTGRLHGSDLILTRTFRAPIEDVWTSVTSSESTARWFGPWEYADADKKQIRFQMVFEEGKPWSNATIEACEAPRLLALETNDASGRWKLELRLAEEAGTTKLELVHRDVNKKMIGEVGPGWEFYLDLLVAAREGKPPVKFSDYYPAQKEYFTALGEER